MSSHRRLARVRRLDCRGEGLLVRVKLARGSKANGPSLTRCRHSDGLSRLAPLRPKRKSQEEKEKLID